MGYYMKEFTSILPVDHGTLDRYFLKTCSEADIIHIQIKEVFSIYFQKCMLCYRVQKWLGPVQTMHAQNKIFEILSVAQTTGRKFSVVKLRNLQNVLEKGETEYCAFERILFYWSNISKNGMFFPLIFF